MNYEYKGKVLIVEDNKVNQMVLKSQLTRIGLDVEVAENGQIALDFLSSSSDYDLIFMDLQMPVMGGIECTENIRKDDRDIPIIAVTANVTDFDKQNCQDCGMNGFIPKPLVREVLLAELEKWFGNK